MNKNFTLLFCLMMTAVLQSSDVTNQATSNKGSIADFARKHHLTISTRYPRTQAPILPGKPKDSALQGTGMFDFSGKTKFKQTLSPATVAGQSPLVFRPIETGIITQALYLESLVQNDLDRIGRLSPETIEFSASLHKRVSDYNQGQRENSPTVQHLLNMHGTLSNKRMVTEDPTEREQIIAQQRDIAARLDYQFNK